VPAGVLAARVGGDLDAEEAHVADVVGGRLVGVPRPVQVDRVGDTRVLLPLDLLDLEEDPGRLVGRPLQALRDPRRRGDREGHLGGPAGQLDALRGGTEQLRRLVTTGAAPSGHLSAPQRAARPGLQVGVGVPEAGDGVDRVPRGDPDRGPRLVVEVEVLVQPGGLGGIRAALLAAPDLPQPVDVAVVQPEHGVERGPVERTQPTRLAVLVPADQAVHDVVRGNLDRARHPSRVEVVPAGHRPAEAGGLVGRLREVDLPQGHRGRDGQRGEPPPLVDVAVARGDEERVRAAVRELCGAEGARKAVGAATPGVVPVRQGPTRPDVLRNLGEVRDDGLEDALEVGEVQPVPRQEEPRVVLTLAAPRVLGRQVVRILLPGHRVDRGLVRPTRRVLRVALLQLTDRQRVREGHRVPRRGLFQCPDVLTHQRTGHDILPFSPTAHCTRTARACR
jgi:hypothetical protein